MDRLEIVSQTLERVAELVGDPQSLVFAKLFARYPEYEAMFVMDTDGGVRGSMFQACLECVLGVAEGKDTPRQWVEASRAIHEGYGLRADELDNMFVAMRDVFSEILGSEWTVETSTAWTSLLDELAQIRL